MVYGLRGRLPSLGYFALVQTSILIPVVDLLKGCIKISHQEWLPQASRAKFTHLMNEVKGANIVEKHSGLTI